jgi:hypothetical protein
MAAVLVCSSESENTKSVSVKSVSEYITALNTKKQNVAATGKGCRLVSVSKGIQVPRGLVGSMGSPFPTQPPNPTIYLALR